MKIAHYAHNARTPGACRFPGRWLATALVSTVLAGCGGGGGGSDPVFSVGGTVNGLSGTLQLVNRSDTFSESLSISDNGRFQFPSTLNNGQSYSVSVNNEPADQRCSISNGSGTVEGADVTVISVDCIDLFQVSGTVSAAAAIGFDSDINDPNAPYIDNSTPGQAQIIENNVFTLHGFASAQGVSQYGLEGRFAHQPDTDDYYRVTLQAGQQIRLQVVDYNSEDDRAPYSGNLDLYLYRFDTGSDSYQLVDFAMTANEFEQVTAPLDGNYRIRVHAYAAAGDSNPGASKYVLSLSPAAVNSAGTAAPVDFVPGEMLVRFKPQSALNSARQSMGAGPPLQLHNPGRGRPTLATIRDTAAVSGRATMAPAEPGDDARFRTLQAIQQVSEREDVLYAEPNYILHPFTTPDDELYRFQWHYPLINLPQAWDITVGQTPGDPVIVAVLDTGIFLTHPDMQGQMVSGYDFIADPARSGDGDGIDSNPDDPGDEPALGESSWHGTHVAGTVAARSNDGTGVAGTAWGARIMPIRVLGYDGGTSADLIEGLRYAAGLSNSSGTVPNRPAAIVNLSLGGGSESQAMQETIDAVRAAGAIVVAAAGNENSSAPSYPAAYDGVVSTSAVTFDELKAGYSNFGPTIDVAAPGGDVTRDRNGDNRGDGVLSAIADDADGSRVAAWAFYQGTSMAAPHVAGVAALMKAVHPDMGPADFDTLLQSGEITRDLGATGRDDVFGHGLIDANLAVREAQRLANGGSLPPVPPQLAAEPYTVVFGGDTSTTLTLSNVGGTPDPVIDSGNINTSASWLSIAPESIDSNGLGDYRLSIDRSGLGNGTYQTVIDIPFTRSGSPDSLGVTATMQVGTQSADGQLTTQYVLLVDADTEEDLQTVFAEPQGNTRTFRFDRVEPGNYFIYSGTDVDNDQLICQTGESCGAFPSLLERRSVSVQGSDVGGLDILVDIVGSIGASDMDAQSTGGGARRRQPVNADPDKALAP